MQDGSLLEALKKVETDAGARVQTAPATQS